MRFHRFELVDRGDDRLPADQTEAGFQSKVGSPIRVLARIRSAQESGAAHSKIAVEALLPGLGFGEERIRDAPPPRLHEAKPLKGGETFFGQSEPVTGAHEPGERPDLMRL